MSSVTFRHPIPYNCSTMAPSRPLVFLVVLYTVIQYTVSGLSRTTVGLRFGRLACHPMYYYNIHGDNVMARTPDKLQNSPPCIKLLYSNLTFIVYHVCLSEQAVNIISFNLKCTQAPQTPHTPLYPHSTMQGFKYSNFRS